MTYVTCRLTVKNRNQLRNPTLGKRVRATFTFLTSYWKQECRRLSCYRRIKAGAWRNTNFQYTILDTAATVEDKLKRISLKCSRSCRDFRLGCSFSISLYIIYVRRFSRPPCMSQRRQGARTWSPNPRTILAVQNVAVHPQKKPNYQLRYASRATYHHWSM